MLNSEAIDSIVQLGQARGAAIGSSRSYVLLELIANRAMDILRADAAPRSWN
jgi:hypothetical protein